MGSKNRKTRPTQDAASSLEEGELGYRTAIACMARSLVADMFEQHMACGMKACRVAGQCLAGDEGGFCTVELDNRQACVFAGMMLFHEALRHELGGYVLLPPLEVTSLKDEPGMAGQ